MPTEFAKLAIRVTPITKIIAHQTVFAATPVLRLSTVRAWGASGVTGLYATRALQMLRRRRLVRASKASANATQATTDRMVWLAPFVKTENSRASLALHLGARSAVMVRFVANTTTQFSVGSAKS